MALSRLTRLILFSRLAVDMIYTFKKIFITIILMHSAVSTACVLTKEPSPDQSDTGGLVEKKIELVKDGTSYGSLLQSGRTRWFYESNSNLKYFEEQLGSAWENECVIVPILSSKKDSIDGWAYIAGESLYVIDMEFDRRFVLDVFSGAFLFASFSDSASDCMLIFNLPDGESMTLINDDLMGVSIFSWGGRVSNKGSWLGDSEVVLYKKNAGIVSAKRNGSQMQVVLADENNSIYAFEKIGKKIFTLSEQENAENGWWVSLCSYVYIGGVAKHRSEVLRSSDELKIDRFGQWLLVYGSESEAWIVNGDSGKAYSISLQVDYNRYLSRLILEKVENAEGSKYKVTLAHVVNGKVTQENHIVDIE